MYNVFLEFLNNSMRARPIIDRPPAFLSLCSIDSFRPNGFDKNFNVDSNFSHKKISCDPDSMLSIKNADPQIKLYWNVSTLGFHSTIFYHTNENRNCTILFFTPETSFLDVPEADDRELPTPQFPQIHFSSNLNGKVEIRHRYPRLNGPFSSTLYPPLLFCDDLFIPSIPFSKEFVNLPHPIFSRTFITYVTIFLPILFLIFHIITVFSSKEYKC